MRPGRFALRAALALLFASTVTWWSPVTALPIYKNEHLCSQACEYYRGVCAGRCVLDCDAAFTGDQGLISACTTACRNDCNVVYKDCRYLCKFTICGIGDPLPCPPDL